MTFPDFIRGICCAAVLSVLIFSSALSDGQPVNVVDIGSRRELLIDGFIVEKMTGSARLVLHHPTPREVVLVFDQPWEGDGSGHYNSVFQDGDKYRMYYIANQIALVEEEIDPATRPRSRRVYPLFTGYAESDDGIHWRKTNVGTHEFEGSTANNIVWSTTHLGGMNLDGGHTAFFKDENPNASDDAKYKAIVRTTGAKGADLTGPSESGLVALKSSDGIRWSLLTDRPIISGPGSGSGSNSYATQNLAFWDGVRNEYRAYWRGKWKRPELRSIRTATSKDLVRWSASSELRYTDSPPEDLYTSQVKPYHRAPHIFVGFPTRYIERTWSDSLRALPDRQLREARSKASDRFGTALTEGLVMSSRDGVNFKRWNEAFLRPGIERKNTWAYGDQYISWHLIETKSDVEGAPNELSLFASEGSFNGKSSALRRYTLRLDGFVSAQATMAGGELITRPLRFQGKTLELNFSTSAAGSVRVEIQDERGRALPGYALADCPPIFGDAIDRVVTWKTGPDVSSAAKRTVRLRFALEDADLYAFQFKETGP